MSETAASGVHKAIQCPPGERARNEFAGIGYLYYSLCYILDLFCSLVLVPWGATSTVLSGTILTYHAEHLVSYDGLQTAIPY
jgi:hypothetical protein